MPSIADLPIRTIHGYASVNGPDQDEQPVQKPLSRKEQLRAEKRIRAAAAKAKKRELIPLFIRAHAAGGSIAELAKRHGISDNTARVWIRSSPQHAESSAKRAAVFAERNRKRKRAWNEILRNRRRDAGKLEKMANPADLMAQERTAASG